VDARTTLLDARLGVTSPKKGCDHGQCGACTVLLDGRRIVACLVLAVAQDGTEIVTAGGLAAGDEPHPMQQSFLDHDGFQCGYCTPAQICSAIGMLDEVEAGWPSVVTHRQSGPATPSRPCRRHHRIHPTTATKKSEAIKAVPPEPMVTVDISRGNGKEVAGKVLQRLGRK
jgi:aerobic-type carbon monoxide dehydrogenase small subunit (CoxS/CutS family)